MSSCVEGQENKVGRAMTEWGRVVLVVLKKAKNWVGFGTRSINYQSDISVSYRWVCSFFLVAFLILQTSDHFNS